AQNVAVALASQRLGDGDRLTSSDGFDGRTCGDEPEERQLQRAAGAASRNEFDGAAAIPRASNEAFFLQVAEMFVNGGERREVEAATDLFETRRVAVLLDELVQVIQDLALTFGERKHGILLSRLPR